MRKKSLIHIPKNGGTTIHGVFAPLKPVAEKHACLQEIKDCVGQDFENWEFLCITRNPYARLYSWFKFHSSKQYENHPDMKMYRGINFEEWINRHCPHHWCVMEHLGGRYGFKYPAYLYTPISQKKFIEVDGEVPKNITFIKLEEIQEKWDQVCDFFGEKKEHRVLNSFSSIGEWETAYNDDILKIATKLLKEDLEYFNYQII